MFDNKTVQEIKFLLTKGYSASKIAKIIKRNKQKTLDNVREIKSVNKKEHSFIYAPIKFLSSKQKKRKERIIQRREKKRELKKKKRLFLTKKDKSNIKELLKSNTPHYRILDLIGKNKEKLVIREIKKQKRIIKKERLKKLKKDFPKCSYNYRTKSHIGYSFNKKVIHEIFIGMTDKQLNHIIKDIKNILNKLNNKVKCPQRMRYFSLEYIITLKDGTQDKSKISSNISNIHGLVSFKNMLNQVTDLIVYLDNLINRSESPKEIKIYNIIMVNYDFKGNIINK